MSHRIEQINELVRHELGQIILTEIEFPKDCLMTIVGVESSKDLRHAKVWISVIPGKYKKKALDKLNLNIGHLQFLLNKKLTMKPLPRLRFVIDDTEMKAQGIEEILDRIRKNS